MRWPLLFVLLCATPAWAVTQEAMVGSWFGTGQTHDRSEMYLDQFRADGSFQSQHRACRKGQAIDYVDRGSWSLSGETMTIAVKTVNDLPEPRNDLYRVVSVDAKTQNYIYLPANFAFHARRVDGKFAMPPCDLTS